MGTDEGKARTSVSRADLRITEEDLLKGRKRVKWIGKPFLVRASS